MVICKDVDEGGHGFCQCTVPEFACRDSGHHDRHERYESGTFRIQDYNVTSTPSCSGLVIWQILLDFLRGCRRALGHLSSLSLSSITLVICSDSKGFVQNASDLYYENLQGNLVSGHHKLIHIIYKILSTLQFSPPVFWLLGDHDRSFIVHKAIYIRRCFVA
jgi:hypothetical protein